MHLSDTKGPKSDYKHVESKVNTRNTNTKPKGIGKSLTVATTLSAFTRWVTV